MGGLFKNRKFLIWGGIAIIVLVATTLSNYIKELWFVGPVVFIIVALGILILFFGGIYYTIKENVDAKKDAKKRASEKNDNA